MAPKRQSPRVTFANPAPASSDTNVRKRKTQSSEEETPGKKRRRRSPEAKIQRLKKGKNLRPLQAKIVRHVDACINTAVLSVLSRKKVPAFEAVQAHLSVLRNRLLQLCKDMRVPASKLGKLRNLCRAVQEERCKMEEYEDALESLTHEIEEAVETTEKIEESIVTLEDKMKALEEKAAEASQSKSRIFSSKDLLQLPQSIFDAPTIQDQVIHLENPEVMLKKVSGIQSKPIYKDMLSLLQTSYAEISTL